MRPPDNILHFLAGMLIVLGVAVFKEILNAKCGGPFNASEVLWTMGGGLFFAIFLVTVHGGGTWRH